MHIIMAKRKKSDLVWTSISKKNLKSTTYFAKFDVKKKQPNYIVT